MKFCCSFFFFQFTCVFVEFHFLSYDFKLFELSMKGFSMHASGSGRGGLDPAFPLLFLENPASRTLFISFPDPSFLSQKNTLKSVISTKANICKM